MYEIHQNPVSSNRAFISDMLCVSGISICCFSLYRFLHPKSFIPLLYLLFHLNLSPLAYFAASLRSSFSSLTFVRLLYLYLTSLSFPRSLPLYKFWFPSHLQPQCRDVNYDQQTVKTYIPLAVCALLYLFPSL